MPRGKRSATKQTAKIVEEKPKKKVSRSKSKKMETNENKVTVGRKRKQKVAEGEIIKGWLYALCMPSDSIVWGVIIYTSFVTVTS